MRRHSGNLGSIFRDVSDSGHVSGHGMLSICQDKAAKVSVEAWCSLRSLFGFCFCKDIADTVVAGRQGTDIMHRHCQSPTLSVLRALRAVTGLITEIEVDATSEHSWLHSPGI